MGEDRGSPQAANSQWFPSSPHTPQPYSLQDTGTETRPVNQGDRENDCPTDGHQDTGDSQAGPLWLSGLTHPSQCPEDGSAHLSPGKLCV